jgi:hypothetical protein
LPSSLAEVLSRALVYSTRPRVSVSGTGTQSSSLRGFSWKYGLNRFVGLTPLVLASQSLYEEMDLPVSSSYELEPGNPIPGRPTLLRHPFTPTGWYGNINPFSIDYASRPHLRSRLTLGGRAFPRNPWAYGEVDSHHLYRYSCRHSHFPKVQAFFR